MFHRSGWAAYDNARMLAEAGKRERYGDHIGFQGHAAVGRSRPRFAEGDADGAAVAGGLGLGLGEERVELREASRSLRQLLFGERSGRAPASTVTMMTIVTRSSMRVRPRREGRMLNDEC